MTQARQKQVQQWQYIYYKQAAAIKSLQEKITIMTSLKKTATATTAAEIDAKIDTTIKIIINIITICDYVEDALMHADAASKKMHAMYYRDSKTAAEIAIKTKQTVEAVDSMLLHITTEIDDSAA